MDSADTSLGLLAHFDAPYSGERNASRVVPGYRYGVPCVLKWAAAIGMLFYAAQVMLQFGYSVSAERALTHAARAAALEATLPRATRASIMKTIERRLKASSIPTEALSITVRHNGLPFGRTYRPADDDQVSVHLSLPADTALPGWLRVIHFGDDAMLHATAERQMPGKHLRRSARR